MDADKVKECIAGRKAAEEYIELMGDDLMKATFYYAQAFQQRMQKQFELGIPPKEKQPKTQLRSPIKQLGATIMPFGAHSGKAFDEVPLEYLDWLCHAQEDFYKDLRAYLTHPDLESYRQEGFL